MGDRPRPGSARDHDKPCVGCGEPIPFTGDNDDQRVCAACGEPDSITPAIRRVPAWTVAVSERSHPDWVYVASDPETGRAIVGYDETVRRFPTDPPPVRCVHRLAAIEIAIVPEETP